VVTRPRAGDVWCIPRATQAQPANHKTRALNRTRASYFIADGSPGMAPRLLSENAYSHLLRVSSFFRTAATLIFVLLGLVLSPAASVRAQSFALATDSVTIASFSGRNHGWLDVALISDDPTFDAASLAISNDANGWIYSNLSSDHRSIRVYCYYGTGADATATVTLRSATHTATLSVARLCIASYRTPKTLLSSDKTKIFALYQDTVLIFDARTQNVLARARLSLPPGFTFSFPFDYGRSFSFSDDESELRVFISNCPLFFRLSTRDLSAVRSLALPPAHATDVRRVFAGEKDGRLYFIRYGAATSPDSDYYYYQRHYQSTIDVVSNVSGELLQSYVLPASEQITTIDDLAIHPDRPEFWLRERRRLSASFASTWLRRLSISDDRLVGETLGNPVELDNGYYATSSDPWSENTPRFLLRPHAPQAVSGQAVFDAAAEPPARLHTLSSPASFLSRNQIAASANQIFLLKTKESLSPSLLTAPTSYSPTIVGLSDDGQDVIFLADYYDAIPVARFLPAVIAAQTANQARVPADGQMTAPPNKLSWYSLPGADHYRVFLSTEPSDLSGEPAPASLIGEPVAASFSLSAALAPGATYFWRVDAIYGDRTITGSVQSFSVSFARIEKLPREVATVAGAGRRDFSLSIVTTTNDTDWKIVSDVPSITVRSGAGTGPGSAYLSLDALALAAGDSLAAVRLVTAAGSVSVPLKLRVQPPSVRDAVTRPGSARILAIGPHVQVNDSIEHLLLSIDTESQQILRCVAIPATTLSITSVPRPSCVAPNAPFHVFESENRFGEFDPESLELKRKVVLPQINGSFVSARQIRPAPDGRIWVLTSNNILARLAADGSDYDLIHPAQTAELSHLSADGASLYTFSRNIEQYYSSSFNLRRYDVSGNALVLTADQTIPYPTPGLNFDVPAFAINPTRLSYRGIAYDENLAPITPMEDAHLAVTDNGSCAFSQTLVHVGDDYSEAFVIPKNFTTMGLGPLYDSVSRKLLSFGYSPIRFLALDDLAAVVRPSLKTAQVNDTEVTLVWEQAPDTGDWASSLRFEIVCRPAGSNQSWATPSAYYSSGFVIVNLSPETAYEVRARVSVWKGVLSDWSEPLVFTTAVPRPIYVERSWPDAVVIYEGGGLVLPLPAIGKALSWQITGLPPGLSLNPATCTFEGSATASGSYTLGITVSNTGGSFTRTVTLNVLAASSANPRARYSGLQAFNYDPLVGDWRATRSGSVVTGYVRTFAGGGSFKVKLPPAAPAHVVRSKSFKVMIDGVNVPGDFNWNTLTDRCSLSLYFYEYGSSTMQETGLGIFHDKTLPHPSAGRYSAFAVEDPEAPSDYLAPEGAGFLRLDLALDGRVTIAAETSLGQRFTTSTSISRDGLVPVFFPWDSFHLWGLLQLDRSLVPPHPRITGHLSWAKYSNRKAAAYRDGFEQQVVVLGAPLPATGQNLPPLAPLENPQNRADLHLFGGGLSRLSKPIKQTLAPGATNLVAPKPGSPENPNRVAVKLHPKTGLVTGSATILDATGSKVVRTQSFRGMFVKNPLGDGLDIIGGYFLFPDGKGLLQSGAVEITEPELPTTESPAP
jgi:hypothetical protein